jgi:hypothetical protein
MNQNHRQIQPQQTGQTQTQRASWLRRFASGVSRFRGAFATKSSQAKLSELQQRWEKLIRDAKEIELGCNSVLNQLTLDRASDPERARASLSEAETQLKRISELIAVFTVLRMKYRSVFQPGPAVIRRIRAVTSQALHIKERQADIKQHSAAQIPAPSVDSGSEEQQSRGRRR